MSPVTSATLLQQWIRFLVSGAITFTTGIAISAFLHELVGAPEEVAVGVALIFLLILGFVLTRHLVFRSSGSLLQESRRYVAISVMSRVMEYFLFLLLENLIAIPYLFALVSALVISFVAKFLLYKNWVYRAV